MEWFDEEAEAQAREAARQERFSKILVLKHMYRPEELQESLDFGDQLAEEIIEECEERLGVTGLTVQIIEEHSQEGMCTVKFKRAVEASAAAKLMNGRFFAGQRVSATIYDGSFQIPKKKLTRKTDFGDDKDEKVRLEEFSKYIEDESNSDNESESSDNSDSSDNSEISDNCEINDKC